MTTTEHRSPRGASEDPARCVPRRVAVAAAQALVAADRKLGRETRAEVLRLAAGSTRRTA